LHFFAPGEIGSSQNGHGAVAGVLTISGSITRCVNGFDETTAARTFWFSKKAAPVVGQRERAITRSRFKSVE
jgi:hypothetical protein